MKIPNRLQSMMDEGLIDEVISQLKSGKEAQVFVVRCGREIRCAKVYKEAHQRSFKQAAEYQEGRKIRGSRDARAMSKRTRHGQKEAESAWLNAASNNHAGRSARVDGCYRPRAQGRIRRACAPR